MRRVLGQFVDLKSLDGILELSWHTDQLHRVGAGLKPDLNRGRIATTARDAAPQRHCVIRAQTRPVT